MFVILVGILVVLLGGSAAAYYGYYVPNQPNSKLAEAFANLAAKKQLNIQGTVDVASTSKKSGSPGVAVDFNLGVDLAQTELATNGTVGVDGTQFPFDIRFVNKDIYFKVGGLDLINKAVPSASTSIVGPYLQALATINNQWYVVDRSFLDSLGSSATCTSNLSFSFSNADVNKIESAYEKDPLFKITGTSPEQVGGVATTEMDLSPASSQTDAAFASKLNSLSVVQNIHKCFGSSSVSSQVGKAISPSKITNSTSDETLAVYVTPDKQIKKIEVNSNSDGENDAISLTFEDQAPTIAAPTGAQPIQNLIDSFLGSNLSGLSN